MKRTILSLALGLVAILTSCQKEDVGITSSSETVTLNVTAQDAFSTRSDGETLRYIMAKYSDASYTTLVDAQESNSTGAFSIVVDKEQDYYILFWADRDASDVFDTDDLTSVSLKSGVTAPAEAWVGMAQITNGVIESSSITLGRAVAKINLMETGEIMADNTLKMSFTHATAFDLTTSAPSATATASREESFTISTAVDGSTTNAKLNDTEIYLFATQAEGEQTIMDITFQMTSSTTGVDAEKEFTVGNVPLKANQATNIIGHYTYLATATFNIYSCNTDWDSDYFGANEVEMVTEATLAEITAGTAQFVGDSWTITDSGSPTADEFDTLADLLVNIGQTEPDRRIDLIFTNIEAIPNDAFNHSYNSGEINTLTGSSVYKSILLNSLTFPNTLTTIGAHAFRYVDITEGLTIPSSVKTIETYAFRDSEIGTLSLSEGLDEIGNGAFQGSDITSLTLPDELTTIGQDAFYGCRDLIGDITIPSSVTTLKAQAFKACDNVDSFTLQWATEDAVLDLSTVSYGGDDIFPEAFWSSYEGDKKYITVPKGSIDLYTAEKDWDYYNLMEAAE